MDLQDVFATNLRRLRNTRKLSQDDLAYEAEVSRSYLSQLEKGAFYASLNDVGRLAKALGRAGRVAEASFTKGSQDLRTDTPAFRPQMGRMQRLARS